MADDNNSRYRSNDPLAELARLIGQNDPFADLGRERQKATARDDAYHDDDPLRGYSHERYSHDIASHPADEPPAGFRSDPAPQYDDETQSYNYDATAFHGGDPQTPPSWSNQVTPGQAAEPLALSLGRAAEAYENPLRVEGLRSGAAAGMVPGDQFGREAATYASAQPTFGPPVFPHNAESEMPPPPQGDDFYDDPPRGNRRRGMLTVIAVLGLAVIGTAGAFGYRHYFGRSGVSSPPPVIRASTVPSKVAPSPSSNEQAVPKFSYDRFGDRGKDEQIVARQEAPVDPKKLLQSGVASSTPAAAPSGAMIAPSANAAGSVSNNPPSVLGEPRRVRTVPIRPEGQPEIAASPPPAITPSPVAPARSAALSENQSRVASVPRSQDPRPQLEAPQTVAPSRQPTPSPSSRRPAAAAPTPARAAANAPLSLSPNDNNRAQSANARAQRAPSPARLAAAPYSGGGGRYLVQVASRRSQADAEASLRSIQAKYSNVLGGQAHVVRRADLGSRGVYYRAMIGPFGTREQALQLCSSLKAAGGDCVVQTN